MIDSYTIIKIFEEFEKENPRPRTELIYTTPFSLVVAVVLSAQATDQSVNKIMEIILPKIDTPQKVVDLGEQNLADLIKSINIYRHKAHYIFQTALILIQKFQAKVPLQREELIQLPGVGQKTANVILNVLTNASHIAVDTHVFRVSHRLGFSEAKTPSALETDLYAIIPQRFWNRTNHWLVLHGRYICKARKPLCEQCRIKKYCPYYFQKIKSS